MSTSSDHENASRREENQIDDFENDISKIKENISANNGKSTSVNGNETEPEISVGWQPLTSPTLAPSTLSATVPLTLGPLPPSPSAALFTDTDANVSANENNNFTTLSPHLSARSGPPTNTYITENTPHFVPKSSYYPIDQRSTGPSYNDSLVFANAWHHGDRQYYVQRNHQSSHVSTGFNENTEIQREASGTNIPQMSSSKCTSRDDQIRYASVNIYTDYVIIFYFNYFL